jgi:hypothetical protein
MTGANTAIADRALATRSHRPTGGRFHWGGITPSEVTGWRGQMRLAARERA